MNTIQPTSQAQTLWQSIAQPLQRFPASLTSHLERQRKHMFSDRGDIGLSEMQAFEGHIQKAIAATGDAIASYGNLTPQERSQLRLDGDRRIAGQILAGLAKQINPVDNATPSGQLSKEQQGLEKMANSLKTLSRAIEAGTPAVLAA